MSDAVTVALITGVPLTLTALGGFIVVVRRQDRAEQKIDTNTTITTETRNMADGRLTKVTDKVDELTKKLAESEANVDRLVKEGIAVAASDALTKASTASEKMLQEAKVTAKALLDQAKVDATALLAQSERKRR